jgi:hypothetical protein
VRHNTKGKKEMPQQVIVVAVLLIIFVILALLTKGKTIESVARSNRLRFDFELPEVKSLEVQDTAFGKDIVMVWQSKTAASTHAGVRAAIELTSANEMPFSVIKSAATIAFSTLSEQVSLHTFATLVGIEQQGVFSALVEKRLAEQLPDTVKAKAKVEISIFFPAYSRW